MISALRDRITLMSPVRATDQGGGYQLSYTEKAKVAARRSSLTGRQVRFAERKVPVRRQRFTFRYRDDLVFEMQIQHCGLTYRITEIQADDQLRFHTVTAEEVRP